MVSTMTNAAVQGGDRAAILDAARAPVVEALHKPVRFKVEQIKVQDGWAFLYADMQDDHGRPIDYAGTDMADAAAHGAVSRSYAALLKRNADGWTVVTKAIGPTDVAWADWPTAHGAPPALFKD